MRITRKIIIVSAGCVGLLLILLITVIGTSQLMANREFVKTLLAREILQATGAVLAYDRLELDFYPLPHLKARNVQLHREEDFNASAESLSIYPRLLPLLKGLIRIRRLSLISPDIHLSIAPKASNAPSTQIEGGGKVIEEAIRSVTHNLYAFAASNHSDIELELSKGTLTLSPAGTPDLRISDIDFLGNKTEGVLSIALDCRTDFVGGLNLQATVNSQSELAEGNITLSGLNVNPLIERAHLPGNISTSDTVATAQLSIHLQKTDSVQGRFNLDVPSMTVQRGGERQLALEQVKLSGSLTYTNQNVLLTVDTLSARDPEINLTAKASITPVEVPKGLALEVHVAAGQLDVAIAEAAARSIAGDLKPIQTAFDVARQGQLTDATYVVGLSVDNAGWHLNNMEASGHLSQGLVTIPGIKADLERMDGDVVFANRQVDFKNVSGHFKGVTFEKLEAAINWEAEPALSIATTAADVDVATLYRWLTTFKGISGVKKYVQSMNGNAEISKLTLSGPLTKPATWTYAISGTPKDLHLTSPLFPFEIRMSGGEITYVPGNERANNVTLEFLDASLVTSYHSKGIVDPAFIDVRVEGSLGDDATDWLGTMVPIPEHLFIKAPIEINNAHMRWDKTQTIAFTGGVKTAGGVTLFADLTQSPGSWHIRELKFSDGQSRLNASARIADTTIDLKVAGNIDKPTANRLLKDNQNLSGRLEGDFHIQVDTREPLNAIFDGVLSGEGLHLHRVVAEPIDVRQFTLDGNGSQLSILSSEIHLLNSRMNVDGVLNRIHSGLTFNLNVNADQIDDALIQSLTSQSKNENKPVGGSTLPPNVNVQGDIHLTTSAFTFNTLTWSPVEADIHLDRHGFKAVVNKADLCGISTPGEIHSSPDGLGFTVRPEAKNANFQDTYQCLWDLPVSADAAYDLSGFVQLPPTRENPLPFIVGNMEFSSADGHIMHTNTIVKILRFINAAGFSSSGGDGDGRQHLSYKTVYLSTRLGDGKVIFDEMQLDGEAMKITGQGHIDLNSTAADITLLVAPLQRVDRVVDRIPGMGYLTGGSLISIPLHVTGPIKDLKVVPMPPSAVGRGVLNAMERILKAPSKIVEGSTDWGSGESNETEPTAAEPSEQHHH